MDSPRAEAPSQPDSGRRPLAWAPHKWGQVARSPRTGARYSVQAIGDEVLLSILHADGMSRLEVEGTEAEAQARAAWVDRQFPDLSPPEPRR